MISESGGLFHPDIVASTAIRDALVSILTFVDEETYRLMYCSRGSLPQLLEWNL